MEFIYITPCNNEMYFIWLYLGFIWTFEEAKEEGEKNGGFGREKNGNMCEICKYVNMYISVYPKEKKRKNNRCSKNTC